MSNVLLKMCTGCHEYTLSEVCPRCGKAAKPNRPAKYSPEDNYGEYRRKLKKLDAAERAAASSTENTDGPEKRVGASVGSVLPVDRSPKPGKRA